MIYIVTLLVIFLASILRGYAGFGFSLAVLPILSLYWPITSLVAMILLLEVISYTQLFVQQHKLVDWTLLLRLLIPALFATPIGIYLLTIIDNSLITIVICSLVLILVFLYALGINYKAQPKLYHDYLASFLAGIFNGALAMSGPVIVMHLMAHPKLNLDKAKTTLISFFLFSELFALIIFFFKGHVSVNVSLIAILATPIAFFGNTLGSNLYKSMRLKKDERQYKKVVLLILLFCAIFPLLSLL